MPRVRFEPTIPLFERATTVHALDRAATVPGTRNIEIKKPRLKCSRDKILEPMSTAYFIIPLITLCVYPPSVVRRGLSKNVTAAKNTHATIEELLGTSLFYAFRVVSKGNRRLVLPRTYYQRTISCDVR
jgi:hypothetical protein